MTKILTKEAKKRLKRRTTIRVMGISILAAAVLMATTKILFDEIFVGDDWSDLDWADDEDFGVDID